MAASSTDKHVTRPEAADRLAQLVQQLRDGRVSVGRQVRRLPASDELHFLTELEDDGLRIEIRWATWGPFPCQDSWSGARTQAVKSQLASSRMPSAWPVFPRQPLSWRMSLLRRRTHVA